MPPFGWGYGVAFGKEMVHFWLKFWLSKFENADSANMSPATSGPRSLTYNHKEIL